MAIDFSLGDFLDSLDSSTMILGALFIIFFALIHFILSRIIRGSDGKPNSAIAGVISLAVSLLAIYGINKIGLDYESLLASIGISGDTLYTLLAIILVVGAIYLLIRVGSLGLLIIGVSFLGVGLTNLVYEKTTFVVIGIVIIIIWAIVSYSTYRMRQTVFLRGGRRYR